MEESIEDMLERHRREDKEIELKRMRDKTLFESYKLNSIIIDTLFRSGKIDSSEYTKYILDETFTFIPKINK